MPLKRFAKDLFSEIRDDNVNMGSAALGFYLMLAIFPALLALLSLIPYLPIPNLQGQVMDMLHRALPASAANALTGTVGELVSNRKGGLLSFGLLFTIWAASSGTFAVMQQLNITYDVKDSRPFWKKRGISLLLTVLFGVLVVVAFGLIIVGGNLQEWVSQRLAWGTVLNEFFLVLRWAIILSALLLAFACMYYFGPDVEQKFRFITPGSVLGTILILVASVGFRIYVENFGKYGATYGSLGAVIVLMLWLEITGFVLQLGSEINALLEHYRIDGKRKGEKRLPSAA